MSHHKISLYGVFILIFLPLFTNVNALNLEKTSWQDLDNWKNDKFIETLPALKQSCSKLKKEKVWQNICSKANSLPNDNMAIREFYEKNFSPYQILENTKNTGLITGYFEPLLQGSLTRTTIYQYPIFGKPLDLERQGDKRYRHVNNKQVPYYTRAEINQSTVLSDNILLWTNDPYLLYFLHVQGSGKIQLNDGSMRHLQFADTNGYPYVSLGGLLIKNNIMKKEDINYYSLLTWMRNNPDYAEKLMNENQRFIFFSLGNESRETRGSLNVPLTAQRSIAIDPKNIPQGLPYG